jgi:two-component system phosphate regulon sensor histidine kinase PhoR
VRRVQVEIERRSAPILLLRARELEQVASCGGRRAVQRIERRCLPAFVHAASRTLRADDVIAHDRDSGDFLAALIAPVRAGETPTGASECRTVLARLATTIEAQTGLSFETGWTIIPVSSADFDVARAREEALARGARERLHLSFFATLAHELRTPLTSIRGYLETLIEDHLDRETTQRFLETARAEAVRMSRLLDGLFDASSLDPRIPAEEAQRADLRLGLAAALNAIAPIAAARLTVISQLGREGCSVLLPPDQLTQILINVLENAVKHGREGGRVYVASTRSEDGQVQITVDDDGPGVPVDERSSIFALACRGSTSAASGSGLGLAVVRRLLERAGGRIDVGDSPLGGARFFLRVPAALDES